MDLRELNRKQVLTLIAIPLMVLALVVVPVMVNRYFEVPTLYGAFGMIVVYFLVDQWMKRK